MAITDVELVNCGIVLPKSKIIKSTSKKSISSEEDIDYDDDVDDVDTDVRNMSVTSYVAHHCKRKNKGNFVSHIWNDIAPMLSAEERTRERAPPNGRRFGCRRKEFLTELIESWSTSRKNPAHPPNDDTKNLKEEQGEDFLSSASSITTPRSRTPSVNTVTVRKSALALPILKYARPQLAIQKEMLHYSDLPLLRRQINALNAIQRQKKFREDYTKTSHDIYRLKLNRPEITKGHFRETCVTYLSNSPGGFSAVTGQLT